MNMNDPVVQAYDRQIAHLQASRTGYINGSVGLEGGDTPVKGRRNMSPEGRAAISAAQSKRWAGSRGTSAKNTTGKGTKSRSTTAKGTKSTNRVAGRTTSVGGRRGSSARPNSTVENINQAPVAGTQMQDPAANLGSHETGTNVNTENNS